MLDFQSLYSARMGVCRYRLARQEQDGIYNTSKCERLPDVHVHFVSTGSETAG